MKKLSIMVAAVLLAGVVSSWANETDAIVDQTPITFKGVLSDKTKIDDVTLGGNLSVAEVVSILDRVTNFDWQVIGSGISLVTTNNGSETNTFLKGNVIWKLKTSADSTKGETTKFEGVWLQDTIALSNQSAYTLGTLSNSAILVTGSSNDKKTNVNAKVTGIWQDGATTVKGTVKNAKKSK